MADIVTNVGKDSVAEKIGGLGSHADFNVLAVGDSGTTATAADTTLASELTGSGLGRATATASTSTSNVLQLVKTWTASAPETIRECGVLNNVTSGGTLLARSNFSDVSVVSDDSIQITYKIEVD